MTIKGKIKSIKTSIEGKPVYGNNDGDIGRLIEKYLKEEGWPVQSGAGPDILIYGIEIKSRRIDATSNQTVGRMDIDDIITTDYDNSPIKAKIQYQIRVYHDGEKIVDVQYYDFTDPFIQDNLKEAYETARDKLVKGWDKSWVPGTTWGAFEEDKNQPGSYQFRINRASYGKIENMTKDAFYNIFEVEHDNH